MFRFRALAALEICICLLSVGRVLAQGSTTTATLTSSTVVTTSTTTITLGQSTSASTTAPPLTTFPTASQSASTTGMTSGSDAGSGNGVYAGSEFQAAVLNSTNFYRKAYQAEPVTWDDTLASFAQDYAGECVWKHSGGEYGENLAMNYETPTLAIDSWAGEEEMYDFAEGEFGKKTGHFTQLVWQGTTRVGCGAVECHGDGGDDTAQGWLLVCEYDPPGNVVGSFQDNVEKAVGGNGQLGLGAASRRGGSARLLVALVAASSLAAVWL